MYTSRYDDALTAYGETLNKYKPFTELVQHIEVRKAIYNLVPLYAVLLQNSHLCKGLPVTSYMLYPIQRIPRYRLLLEGKHVCLHDSKSGLSKNGGTEDCWGTCKDTWTCFHALCPLGGSGGIPP